MSAADHVVIRTRSGDVRVVPRRAALGMIARGKATAEPRRRALKVAKPVPVKITVPKVGPAKGAVLPPKSSLPVVEEASDNFRAGRSVVERPNHPTTKARKAAAAEVEPVTAVVPVGPVVDVVEPAADVTALPVEAPAVDVVKAPRLSASRKAWAEYASTRGIVVSSDMTRNTIRDLVAELDNARMSRPAFTDFSVDGGRPATPEDVPVTKVVTRADPDDATA